MNIDHDLNDESAWNEHITTSVKYAADLIHALPQELRSRALVMLVAVFDRELKPVIALRRRYKRY